MQIHEERDQCSTDIDQLTQAGSAGPHAEQLHVCMNISARA